MKKIIFLLTMCLFGCKTKESNEQKIDVSFKKGMIVSAREEASRIGIEIMKKGGNAFDAMVATDAALAVCFPFAGNIGGGGFMVYRLKDGTTGTLDYREKAPKAAHEKMYQDENGNVIPRLSMDGALAVGVPGTVAGMWEAHQKFGKLSWKEVIQPAIDLAKNGFYVTEKQAEMLKHSRELFQKVNKEVIYFDKDWKKGDKIIQPNLAKTLEKIRDFGRDGFYKGEVAKKTVAFLQENGGIITEQDLENYNPVWRKPIQFKFNDFDITTMGPPSSGGIVLAQILKTIEDYPLNEMEHNGVKYIQLITEAERRAYADRSKFLGDPDFVNVPLDELMDDNYIKSRMKTFDWNKASKSTDIAPGEIEWAESNETTHYSIVDSEGNAISVTTTLNGAYGSKLYSNELGYFFNNEMDDFSAKPGEPNMFGLIGGATNKIEPEKRMLSSMTPTIVARNGKLYMVLGTPGGSTIITTVLQTILNETIYDMSMQDAVSAPRFHHQWLPDEVVLEPNGFDAELIKSLEDKGYIISEKDAVVLGKMDAIRVLDDGSLEAGADPRGDDSAVGF